VCLKNRSHDFDDTIAELERQHMHGAKLIRRLNRQLGRYEFEGMSAFPAFRDQVQEYAGFYFGHMRLEEEIILPAAGRFFKSEDWAEVNAAFSSNIDPLSGMDTKDGFDKLFSMIVRITPAPMGVGDPIKAG
ncbi:MAG: hemerythrin domain-containing protein, partial [Herbaspirillum sp.]